MFSVVWWHSEWIVSSGIRMLLKACRMFIKFIDKVWVCQYQCFTWSYQPTSYIWISILTLTHIEPMFQFGTSENFWKLYGFLTFSGGKNRTLVWYGLRTYLMLLTQPAFTCLKLTIETLEQDAISVLLVSLLLTLNIFHPLL